MDQMFEDPAFMHRAISVRGQMVIPVGAILHSFSKQIHAAYGHASQGGDWRWALRRAHWQDRRCFKKMLVPGHRKHSRPKVLTGHISLPGMFPHLGKSEAAGAPWQGVSTPVLRKKKEGGALVIVAVCHGPLAWGQRSHLSSFTTTLVERYPDPYLVRYLYSLITMYLSSPSALPSPPHTAGLIPAEGINGPLKKYHRKHAPAALEKSFYSCHVDSVHIPSEWQ